MLPAPGSGNPMSNDNVSPSHAPNSDSSLLHCPYALLTFLCKAQPKLKNLNIPLEQVLQ
jgi:hypothetical protein